MLTREENELLTRTGPGTPMGELMRRYWLPAMLSGELEADGEPKQLQLLGQRFVTFRDTAGQVGLLDENCPHRGASLAYGRNEECGLRCIYHGWKVDVQGNIVDTPSEPEDSTFGLRIKHPAYRVHEVAGLIWAYLGPAEKCPPFPNFESARVTPEQIEIDKVLQECNFAQGLEGSIDSVHSDFLHSSDIRGRPSDHRPVLEAEDRFYGFRYAAVRKPDTDAERAKYARITLFVAPCFVFIPPQRRDGDEVITHQAWVPVDDEHNYFYSLRFKRRGPIVASHGAQFQVDDQFRPRRNRANKHLQDRAAMKNGNWTGIQGVNSQDFAVVESMGPIYDRTREHLGATDVAIIRFRRWLMRAARELAEEGIDPPGLDGSETWADLAAEERIVPIGTPWQEVSACS